MPKNQNLKSILIIGSGPIVIGQACEFDYSGTQALRSLREDGIETVLINSNPATIMTDPTMADHVYLLPLNTKSLIQILKEHPQIDAVLPTMGGQTALNLCIEADDKGIWKDFDVKLIGVDIDAINITEDRELFRKLMIDIGIGYSSNMARALEIMREEVSNHPLHIDSRAPEDIENNVPLAIARVTALGDSAVNLRVWAWAKDSNDGYIMYCDLLESIKTRFDAESIEIPFPQRTITYPKVDKKD